MLKKSQIFVGKSVLCLLAFTPTLGCEGTESQRKGVGLPPPAATQSSDPQTQVNPQTAQDSLANTTNHPPIFKDVKNVETSAGKSFGIAFDVSDPDLEEIASIEYFVNDTAIGGPHALDPRVPIATLKFPEEYANGTVNAWVSATDARGAKSTAQFTIFVKAKRANCAGAGTIGESVACYIFR